MERHDAVTFQRFEWTVAEQREFQSLTDQLELADAERLKYLIQLARIRRQPLELVLRDLEIPQGQHA